MLRTFRISQELKNYIRKILQKRDIPYKLTFKEEGIFIEVPLSGQRFHRIVQRAKCEKLTKETGIVHVTRRESENIAFLDSLLKEYGTGSFVITDTITKH